MQRLHSALLQQQQPAIAESARRPRCLAAIAAETQLQCDYHADQGPESRAAVKGIRGWERESKRREGEGSEEPVIHLIRFAYANGIPSLFPASFLRFLFPLFLLFSLPIQRLLLLASHDEKRDAGSQAREGE